MNTWTTSLRLKFAPGNNAALLLGLLLGLLLVSVSRQVVVADEDGVQSRINTMTASEKRELQRKRDRFDRLPAAEQTRLRALHQEIQQHQDSEQLMTVVEQYSDWLTTLSASQRTDLLSLPVDERLKRIREIKRRSEEDRFGRFTTRNLNPEDARQIFDWLDGEVIAGEEERLTAMLDDGERKALKMIDDDSRRRFLMLKMLYRRNPNILDKPSAEQIDNLVARLSSDAKRKYRAQEDDEQKQLLVRRWIQAAMASRLPPPPVSPDELQRYFAEDLRPEEREELERMPRDRMYRELSRMYFRDHMRRHMESRPGGGPPWRERSERDRRRRGDRRGDEPGRDRGRSPDSSGPGRPPPPAAETVPAEETAPAAGPEN